MIEKNKRYGCLIVLDLGEEYEQSEKYKEYLLTDNKNGLRKHYKCVCKHCGKLHYYDEHTLESNPRYCYYPVSIANLQHNYSIKAHNANYRKRQKYADMECVFLWTKPSSDNEAILKLIDPDYEPPKDCNLPSEEYCDKYNSDTIKKLEKKDREFQQLVEELPRIYAKNYDEDYIGRQYESLSIVECVNDHLESKPQPYFTQPARNKKRKHWSSIYVYKQYRCKCTICGTEQLIKCDKFGIHPPTDYGYRAYNGYWSEVSCKCHHISSFQWIVSKILFESHISYGVEYSFPDLYGTGEVNLLRFDFVIYNDDKSVKHLIECQGEQHYKPVEEFGGEAGFRRQKANDELKRAYAKDHNLSLIEISYKDKTYEKIKDILHGHGII